MHSSFRWLVLLPVTVASTLTAQPKPNRNPKWGLGLSIGTATFNGATTSTGATGEDLVFVPYRPTMVGVAVERGGAGARAALSLKYGEPGIGFRGVPLGEDGEPAQGLLLVAENAFKLATITGAVSTRVVRLRGGPSLRPLLGLSVERWSAPGTPARTLLGLETGLGLEMELSGPFIARIDGELGFTPKSPFRAEDLPEGFAPHGAWRRGISVSVGFRR